MQNSPNDMQAIRDFNHFVLLCLYTRHDLTQLTLIHKQTRVRAYSSRLFCTRPEKEQEWIFGAIRARLRICSSSRSDVRYTVCFSVSIANIGGNFLERL